MKEATTVKYQIHTYNKKSLCFTIMSKANVSGSSDLGIVDEIDESIKLWNMYVSNFPENGVAWMKLGMVTVRCNSVFK